MTKPPAPETVIVKVKFPGGIWFPGDKAVTPCGAGFKAPISERLMKMEAKGLIDLSLPPDSKGS